MTKSHPDSDTTLRITRVYAAPPDRVFKAFTDPEMLRQWWAPDDFTITDIDIDPDSGLGTRFSMVDDSTGDRYTWDMDYEVLDEPNRLRWISIWVEGFADNRETVVTVEFRAVEGGTEVSLMHAGFPDRETRDDHKQGWSGGLDKLEGFLSSGQFV